MVEKPDIHLTVSEARQWTAEGPESERALAYAHQFGQWLLPRVVPPHHIRVQRISQPHSGLGTGTQLGLAVAAGLRESLKLSDLSLEQLAAALGRGGRSAIGIHGFTKGGFLLDGGIGKQGGPAPLVARTAFPELWRIVLITPRNGEGLHGESEKLAFHSLHGRQLARHGLSEVLCRLVVLGMLPALAEENLDAFGEALYEFNHRVGEVFASFQGGPYSYPRAEEIVGFIRGQKTLGVAQSSWGPTLFAVVENAERADDLARAVRERFSLTAEEVITTSACNRGAVTEVIAGGV